ncbi:MAG: alpha/beta hydrolase [Candidatus Dormibacteraeota bacterium]|nr:alpha/beta hydrolase [Candidatus Dormibacteraeota bacterium]
MTLIETVDLHFEVAGSGPRTVMFLHGLAGHGGEWASTVESLGPAFTTTTLDQRGHGRSTRVPRDVSREAFADDVAAVIRAAEATTPVVLVGHSMGAHTAFITAARHPGLVETLVMVEGDIGGGGEQRMLQLHDAIASWPTSFDSYESVRDFFGGDTTLGRAWANGYEHRDGAWWPRFDPAVMDAIMTPIFAHECWQQWRRLRVPTHLVVAERTATDLERISRMCQARPDVQLTTVPDAGHDLHLEQPQAFLQLLLAILAT